ncbi:MAG: hypothetical protein ACKOB2_01930 [Solirubrobacterales bacterium]
MVLCLAVFASLVATGGPAGVPTQAEAAKGQPRIGNLFNSRYCEIFGISSLSTGGYSVATYNSVGLGRCPQAEWAGLDFKAIADREGWLAASPHGPRYWLMDSILGARQTEPKDFGGIGMRHVATLATNDLQPPPFTELRLQMKSWRGSTSFFRKGRTIHTLTDPSGTKWVMQAYTRTEDPTLGPRTLRNLPSNPKAAIPEGWTFRTRTLKKPLSMRSGGSATIIRDGVRSIYQKLD